MFLNFLHIPLNHCVNSHMKLQFVNTEMFVVILISSTGWLIIVVALISSAGWFNIVHGNINQ